MTGSDYDDQLRSDAHATIEEIANHPDHSSDYEENSFTGAGNRAMKIHTTIRTHFRGMS